MTILYLITDWVSDLCVFYVDDGTMGCSCDEVLQDVQTVERIVGQLGLSDLGQKQRLFVTIKSHW